MILPEPGPSSRDDDPARQLAPLFTTGRVLVLTGAGCSTESGIPDYRGPETARRARNPVQYREFVSSPSARRRYWSRSLVGWPAMSRARPNPAHLALAELEGRGRVLGLITQNVDDLHRAAGSARLLELHGSLSRVRCLSCPATEDRARYQERLLEANPGSGAAVVELAPDGDAERPQAPEEPFVVPACLACGGVLKPDVVFFGENVPRPLVEEAYRWVEESAALLVVGSSLEVFSGFRFVRRAKELGRAVAILNLGPSRGDALADLKLEAKAGELLPRLLDWV